VAAANRRDRAHRLSAELVAQLGRELLVPNLVMVEVDQLLRARVSATAARAFLEAMARGEHAIAVGSRRLLRRAVEIDARYADLGLGLVDATVMAVAEQQELPILTYDFEHFRATRPARGYWRLVVDEARFREMTA
jgi:predicted nucleic acid-binding protein